MLFAEIPRNRNEPANAQGEIQVTRRRKLLDSNNQDVRARIQEELDGPGCLPGYRSMWHSLRREGYQVSRQAVVTYLQEMVPKGCERRRRLGQTIGILMGMTKLNLTVSRSMAVLTVTAAR